MYYFIFVFPAVYTIVLPGKLVSSSTHLPAQRQKEEEKKTRVYAHTEQQHWKKHQIAQHRRGKKSC